MNSEIPIFTTKVELRFRNGPAKLDPDAEGFQAAQEDALPEFEAAFGQLAELDVPQDSSLTPIRKPQEPVDKSLQTTGLVLDATLMQGPQVVDQTTPRGEPERRGDVRSLSDQLPLSEVKSVPREQSVLKHVVTPASLPQEEPPATVASPSLQSRVRIEEPTRKADQQAHDPVPPITRVSKAPSGAATLEETTDVMPHKPRSVPVMEWKVSSSHLDSTRPGTETLSNGTAPSNPASAMPSLATKAVTATVGASGQPELAADVEALTASEPKSAFQVESGRSFEVTAPARNVAAREPAQAETARQIAIQITQNGTQTSDTLIEVQLSPEELGVLKFRIGMTDQGPSVFIQAERSDTQDLLRRHIDQLQAQFASMGLGDASIAFSQNGADPEATSDPDGLPPDGDMINAEDASAGSTLQVLSDVGVDIRL